MFYEISLPWNWYIWIVGKVTNNLLQEKKDETCSEEQVMKIQDSLQ